MNNKIIKNASWIIVCRVAQSLLNLVVSMIMARYLGPSNYGVISYAASLVAFAVPIVQLGLNNIIVHEVVDKPDKEGETMGTTLGLTIVSSLLGVITITAISFFINYGERDTIIICALYSISLIFQMTEMIHYWYQAKLMSKYVALASLFSRVIVSLYKIYLILSAKSVFWFAIVHGLDYLIISFILFFTYKKMRAQKLTFSFEMAKHLIAQGKHFVIPGIMVSIFSQTDKIMLKHMIGDASSGYYTAAVTCAGMTVFVFSAVIESCRPVIFANKKTNKRKYEDSIVNMYSVVIYMALVQSVVFTVGADLIVNILYGTEFLPTVPILRIITWHSAFSYIGSANIAWMLAEDKHKYLWIINLSGVIVNIFGNCMLIPIYGECGAALASLGTQFFINYLLYFIIKPFRENARLLLKGTNPMTLVHLIKLLKKK